MLRDHVLPASVVGFLLLCGALVLAMRPAPPEANSVERSAVAVVELFTSAACEPCLPADSLLVQLQQEALTHDRAVYALDYHVDFQRTAADAPAPAHAVFSERQRKYARALGDHVYTPQMVVNGTHAFIGSDAFHARRSIGKALRQQAPVQIRSEATRTAGGDVSVTVRATGAFHGAALNVALIGGAPSPSAVPHRVRAYATASLDATTSVRLTVPDAVDLDHASVIAFAQNPSTMAVLGATRTHIE